MSVRITVVKRGLNSDLIASYFPDKAGKIMPCSRYQDGQVFEVKGTLPEKPEGLCDWAWVDIHQIVTLVMARGQFPPTLAFPCCTDGLRPVTFHIEAVETI